MLLTEFTRTRVLELAVHGLDLAKGLDREPWMTASAAQVTEELLLPSPDAAAELRTTASWDQVTLIAKLTGRATTTAAETKLIRSLGTQRLALGSPRPATAGRPWVAPGQLLCRMMTRCAMPGRGAVLPARLTCAPPRPAADEAGHDSAPGSVCSRGRAVAGAQVASRRKAQHGSSRTVFHEGSDLSPGDTDASTEV